MITTAETAQTIFKYITSAGTIYDEIICNIISPNFHQKDELISELAISFLGKNKPKVNKALKENWFDYYFITAVKNQVHSSTSSFHKNCRRTLNYSLNNDYTIDDIDAISNTDDDLKEKELIEIRYEALNDILDEIRCSWFEKEIFKL